MAESLDVGVAVLRDYRFDARRVGESETQTDWGAIVEYIYGVGVDVQRCEEGADCQAQILESEDIVGGIDRQAESWEIGGEDVVGGG